MLVSRWVRSLLVTGLATATAIGVAPVVTFAAHAPVDVVVKNWSFTPSSIEAHVGEPALLRFADSEGVHGVESAEIGLPKTMIVPGKITEVTFTPKTVGTFDVHCAIVCGDGHDKMALTAHVVP